MTELDATLLTGVLKRATARGATAADGFLIEEQSFSASVRLGQVDTVTHSREQRLALRVFAGRASAAASTSDLSRDSLERVVDEATALARVTSEDLHAGLPEAQELIERVPDLELEDHEGSELTPEEKIELARRAEAAALAAELAGKPPVALRLAKRATAIAPDVDGATGCRYEVEAFGVAFATEDRVEGLGAFRGKRVPSWKGR